MHLHHNPLPPTLPPHHTTATACLPTRCALPLPRVTATAFRGALVTHTLPTTAPRAGRGRIYATLRLRCGRTRALCRTPARIFYCRAFTAFTLRRRRATAAVWTIPAGCRAVLARDALPPLQTPMPAVRITAPPPAVGSRAATNILLSSTGALPRTPSLCGTVYCCASFLFLKRFAAWANK